MRAETNCLDFVHAARDRPQYAEIDDPTIELSPGTCVLNDVGYTEHFPDLVFPPAAVLLTAPVVDCSLTVRRAPA